MSLTPSTMLPLGTSAPAFSLPDTAGKTVVDFGPAIYTLNLHDNLTGGILVGQKIYYEDTAHGSLGSQFTHLGNRATGAEAFFGVALGPEGAAPPLDRVERAYVARVLEHCGGRRMAAAQALGISYPTFLKRLRELGLE